MFKKIFFVLLLHQVKGKHIDVTIMVPGLKAFERLGQLVQYVTDKQSYYDYNLTNVNYNYSYYQGYDSTGNNGSEIYQSQEAEEYQGDKITELCLNNDDDVHSIVNVICIHDINWYFTYSWSYIFVKPALDVALQKIKETKGLLDGYDMSIHYYDIGDQKGKSSDR